MQSVLSTVLTAVRERLSAQDQDQEVKECAVSCTAFSVATVGDSLHADVPGLLQVRQQFQHCRSSTRAHAEESSFFSTERWKVFLNQNMELDAVQLSGVSCRFCWNGCEMRPHGSQQ